MVFADLDSSGARIALDTSWVQKDQVKSIPGARWSNDDRRWSLPLSWASALGLRAEFGPTLVIGQSLRDWAKEERANRIDPSLFLRDATDIENYPWIMGDTIKSWRTDTGPSLYAHQEAAAAFLVTARNALLGDEMGVGKTASVLSAVRLLKEALGEDPFPVLVVCPNTLKRNWAREVETWLPGAAAFPLVGTALQRRKQLAAAKQHPAAVVIVNIEAVRTMSRLAPYGSVRLLKCTECDKKDGEPGLAAARCEVHPKELNTFEFQTCIGDELHRVKDPKAKQTRAIWSVFHGPTVRYRYAMTGTPIANHPGDLWSVMHSIAPQEYPRRSAFIERFAQVAWNAYGMEILGLDSEHKAELFGFLDPRFRRMPKSRVLAHLPAKVFTTREVEMSPKQAAAYRGLEDRAAALLDTGDVLLVGSDLALSTRLLQLAASYCNIDLGDTPDDPATWQVELCEPSSKIDEMMSIIEELDGASVAIAAEHRRLLELAGARLEKAGIPHVFVTGAVDEHQRAQNVADFQSGKIKVLLYTYKAGGVGINLTAAGTLVRLQRSWSLVDHKQGEDRVHRIGSEIHASVNIIDIVTADTIESRQLEALSIKTARLDEINRDEAK